MIESNHSNSIRKATAFLAGLLCLWGFAQLAAQKVVVLTNADLAKVVTVTHHYSDKDPNLKVVLRHRISGIGALQVSLQKQDQFDKSPFTLKSTLPATVQPEQALEIDFGVTYSKGLQNENTISLLAVPLGDADSKSRGIAINVKLSVDGMLMFFSDRTKQYSKTLPTFEFVGEGQKLVEIAWNGGGGHVCTFNAEQSGRQGFTLTPNAPGASPLREGEQIKINSGGNSFFIHYDGAAKKGGFDVARFTFTEQGGQSIRVEMMGTYQGGASLFASARDLLKKDKLIGESDPIASLTPIVPVPTKDTPPKKEPNSKPENVGPIKIEGGNNAEHSAPVVAPTPTKPEIKADPGNISRPSSSLLGVVVEEEEEETGLSEIEATDRMQTYFVRYRDQNMIKVRSTVFEKNDGIFETRIPIGLDSLVKADPNFHLALIWVKAIAGADTVALPQTNYKFEQDSSKLLVKLSEEAVTRMSAQDSFKLQVGFMPEYLSGDNPVYGKSLIFKGICDAKIHGSAFWKWMLWSLGILAVGLFFFIGYLLAKSPVTSFRYLRESRYQRERHKANSERTRVDVETVHIDLARQETDLIQLAFVDRGEGLDGRQGESIEKIRGINATVPLPRRGGFVRMFVWLYGPFGRKRDRKFKSVYYSLRIELPKGSVPQHLRLKDETGMIMLGTSLTGNVLATDHQDFKINKCPFSYSIYLDPSEFLDYTGAMRTVSIPFRVIEEPFEGYVMTREFNLNLEIAHRF